MAKNIKVNEGDWICADKSYVASANCYEVFIRRQEGFCHSYVVVCFLSARCGNINYCWRDTCNKCGKGPFTALLRLHLFVRQPSSKLCSVRLRCVHVMGKKKSDLSLPQALIAPNRQK